MKNAISSVDAANFSTKQRELLTWIKESPFNKVSIENGAYFWEAGAQLSARSFNAFAAKMDEAGVKRDEWLLNMDAEKSDEGNPIDEPTSNVPDASAIVQNVAAQLLGDEKPKSKLAKLADAMKPAQKLTVKSSEPRYEGPSLAQMFRDAIASFEGSFSSKVLLEKVFQVAEEKGVKEEDLNQATMRCYISQMSVNYPGRVNWGINKKDRVCSGEHGHDKLYKLGRSEYIAYDPETHGVWQIKDGEVSQMKEVK